MDNQHKQIKGYRDLTQEEIDLMNKVKEKAEEVKALVQEIAGYHADTGCHAVDMRWLNIAQDDLQKGFMSAVRSIARPSTF